MSENKKKSSGIRIMPKDTEEFAEKPDDGTEWTFFGTAGDFNCYYDLKSISFFENSGNDFASVVTKSIAENGEYDIEIMLFRRQPKQLGTMRRITCDAKGFVKKDKDFSSRPTPHPIGEGTIAEILYNILWNENVADVSSDNWKRIAQDDKGTNYYCDAKSLSVFDRDGVTYADITAKRIMTDGTSMVEILRLRRKTAGFTILAVTNYDANGQLSGGNQNDNISAFYELPNGSVIEFIYKAIWSE